MRLVSVPYEITLLSNLVFGCALVLSVSVPYEITLLSNKKKTRLRSLFVSVPYEITLLSNLNNLRYIEKEFQYLMKLHYSQTSNKLCHYNAQGNNIRYIYYTI